MEAAMLCSTFQLAPGIGPTRERALWRYGVACWSDYDGPPSAALKSIDRVLRTGIDAASAALAKGDIAAIAALLPQGEHWRLFDTFANGVAYLDIETCDDVVGRAGISAIGVVDRQGPRLFLAGRDLEQFPERARDWSLLVTFNGSSFDLPLLRRAFPEWQPPLAHVDLRHALGRLGHRGTLKQLEEWLPALHLERPEPLRRLNASGASALYHRGQNGDREALRTFAEYNLYDAVNLRTLMAYTYNGLVERLCARTPTLRRVTRTLPIPGRGDVLYDISKILLSL
jgi:uncharacterized protein YprB with RNaseH-like and TPR domain